MKASAPRAFFLGVSGATSDGLCSLFENNGYEVCRWEKGRLAEDILFAKAAGRQPLEDWPSATLFADMVRVHRVERPPLLAFREFPLLFRYFPDAVFLLPEDEPSGVRFHSEQNEAQHRAEVLEFFADRGRQVLFRADDLAALSKKLVGVYDLAKLPEPSGRLVGTGGKRKEAPAGPVESWRADCFPAFDSTRQGVFVDEIVRHCAPRAPAAGDGLSDSSVSTLFAEWDGRDHVRRADGSRWPLRRLEHLGRDIFVGKSPNPKLPRLEGVLNDVLGLGRALPLRLDMEDARKFGEPGWINPARPTLTYNRRASARNVALWPLPGYHTIGSEHFAHPGPVDEISYLDKMDRVVWRGNLTGRSNFHFPDRGPLGRSSHVVLEELQQTDPGSPAAQAIVEELRGMTRFRVVERFSSDRDFDVALTLAGKFASLIKGSALGPYCDSVRPRHWFHRFRYALCLSGHDTGSNFFDVASSNSLMLKEDDGWELFYSAGFRPWEHYVPLEAGAADLPEKLEWARSHPKMCEAMAQACQQLAAKFAAPELRAKVLNGVLDHLTA